MPYVQQIAAEKASIINRNKKIYGTFAEIGAGQEVVNYFFKAGQASQTVAKSISAYDMIFSNLIYGKAKRYVCEQRLTQMLQHEYSLLESRLKKTRGSSTCFFTLANTVAVSTLKTSHITSHHGWIGIRFQTRPLAKYSEILLHVNLLDRTRLQQYEALGALGVNLIYTAFYGKKDPKNFVRSLVDNFEKNRIEFNVIKCKGPAFKNFKSQNAGLELLKQELSPFILLHYNESPLDLFYEKSLHLITDGSKFKIKKDSTKDLYLRISTKPCTRCLIHKYQHLYELKQKLREYTQKKICFYVSLKEFKDFINPKNYKGKTLIQIYGSFFDAQTKMTILASEKQLVPCPVTKKLIKDKKICFSKK